MEKILVATDLSTNSIPAIQLAYKVAQARGAKLIILYVYNLVKPKKWRIQRFENFKAVRKDFVLNKLEKFSEKAISTIGISSIDVEIELQINTNTTSTVIKSIIKHNCAFFFLSTNGAGKSKNFIGSTANKLLIRSPIPTISVPSTFKMKPILSVCYCSDMTNYIKETKKVIGFVKPLNLETKLLYVSISKDNMFKKSSLETKLLRRTGIKIKTKQILKSPNHTIIEDIGITVKKMQTSLIALFIKRNKLPSEISSIHSAINPSSSYKKTAILFFKR